MDIKRIVGPLVAVILIVGIGVGVYISHGRKTSTDALSSMVTVKGMIGSEKEPFFMEPKTIEILKNNKFQVSIEKVGSREITKRDLKGYDFVFPSGMPAAIALQEKIKAKQIYTTFYTPMAIASWKSLVPLLEKEGIVKKSDGAYYVIDMKRLLAMSGKGVRWKDLKDNTVFSANKSILINSTDVRKSNSAAMYLSLASYIANDNNVVDSDEQVTKVLPFVAPLFLRQGLQESSSAGPFEDYVTMGIGKAPLVMIYESQFLEYQSKRAKPNEDMVLLYPQPTVYTKHIIVPITENGRRFAELLATNTDLQKIAAQYGFRTSVSEYFSTFLKEKKLSVPTNLVEVIDPPSYGILEKMIQAIETQYK
jgi:hypothetical protein